MQLAQAKALEIEGLLERLSDINARMSSQLSGGTDTQTHTVANHRDKLHDFTQARHWLCSDHIRMSIGHSMPCCICWYE